MKHSFVASHPGTEVPCGVLTVTVSANAGCMPIVMATTNIAINGNTVLFCIFIKSSPFHKDKKLVLIERK
jgi:hypothetical protein